MNKTTANVDIYFAKKIATIIDLDPEPASLANVRKDQIGKIGRRQ